MTTAFPLRQMVERKKEKAAANTAFCYFIEKKLRWIVSKHLFLSCCFYDPFTFGFVLIHSYSSKSLQQLTLFLLKNVIIPSTPSTHSHIHFSFISFSSIFLIHFIRYPMFILNIIIFINSYSII